MAKWIKLSDDKFVNVDRLIYVQPTQHDSYLRKAGYEGQAVYSESTNEQKPDTIYLTGSIYLRSNEFDRLISYLEHTAV